MSDAAAAPRVFLVTRDLFFRSKLAGIVRTAGAEATPDDADCDLAVIELGHGDAAARIRGLRARGVAVLAFGSHVRPEDLRTARAEGALAVPNSQVEAQLRALLAPETTQGHAP